MRKYHLILCLFLIASAFILFILSLLALFPKTIAGLFLFFSIFYTVSSFNNRHRFRGFE